MKQILWAIAVTITVLCTHIHGHGWNVASMMRTAQREATFQEQEEALAAEANENSNSSLAVLFLSSSQFLKEVGNLARGQRLALELLHNATGLEGDMLFKLLRQEFGCSTLPKNYNHTGPDYVYPAIGKDMCPFPILQCNDTYPYRSADGSCNNLFFPSSGQARRAQARLLQPDYSDKINAPRKAKSGNQLPSARAVSSSLFENQTRTNGHFTSMHMTFGQLLDHDTDRTAVSMLMINGTLVDYKCGSSGCETEGVDNAACFPIAVDASDPAFGHKECLTFVRSQEFIKDDCEIGPREQPNSITSWLDASFVYGSDTTLTNRLRDFSDSSRGKLRVTANEPFKPLLPQQENKPCKDVDDKIRCFLTGDSRQNEQVALIALHTVFTRLHNFYEEELYKVNPHWGGERLYQESRRLLIAVWQHIVYNEYLPVVLGSRYCREFDIKLRRTNYYKGYNPEVFGDVFNVFSTAAFRFGHSQISPSMLFTDKTYQQQTHVPMSSLFFRPRSIYESPIPGTTGVDSVMLGSVSQSVEAVDRFFTDQVTVSLFSLSPPHVPGMDLGALNIQRGRDHGIPGYTSWRKWCGLSVPDSFNDITSLPQNVINNFRNLYESVEDIDLFPAAMSEEAVNGGIVGETFACLIAHQFKVLRQGDRFWYETDNEHVKFTLDQLDNVREITLSRLLCDTLDEVDTIQKYSMVAPKDEDEEQTFGGWFFHKFKFKGNDNERVPCDQHPNLNFNLWKET